MEKSEFFEKDGVISQVIDIFPSEDKLKILYKDLGQGKVHCVDNEEFDSQFKRFDLISDKKLNEVYLRQYICEFMSPANFDFIKKYITDLLEFKVINVNFIHNKTHHEYKFKCLTVSATNNQDGVLVVVYSNQEGIFTRELNEFLMRFTYEG